MSYKLHSFLLAITLAMVPFASSAANAAGPEITAKVQHDGKVYQIDAEFLVAATPQEAWNVLTDYDHMAEFVSNVSASRILTHEDGKANVAQTVRAGVGPFKFTIETVREVVFVPVQEIRSKLIKGDMKSSAFTTRVAAADGGTRITYHGEFIPDRWIPPLIGPAVIEEQTRKQFTEFRDEIMRRKALVAG
jgi:carbon monoxide dehydrogenase subunit G